MLKRRLLATAWVRSMVVAACRPRAWALWPIRVQRSRRSLVALLASVALAAAGSAPAKPLHGLAMHGLPALDARFSHLPYADPDAPRGGEVAFAALGTFDSLNPLIVKGKPAAAVRDYVFESLLKRNFDEPFALYGLLAETVETPDDRAWVEFRLREEARFSDGTPVTVDDVIFSLETLRQEGRPNHRSYYSKVQSVGRPDERTVRFVFDSGADREMPLIMGLMPILARHHYARHPFSETTLVPPVGSGPYVIADVEPGSALTYRRNPDYWGDGLAINRGFYNFDTIRYEYYRQESARFEALKKGLYDFQQDHDPARWATGYSFPAVAAGRMVREDVSRETPAGMLGLVFNTRRAMFADKRVRRALTLMFDFDWLNENLYYGLYRRTQGYYDGSELSSVGRPASAAERALLDAYPGAVDAAVLEGSYALDGGGGSGRNRERMRQALALLNEAGYALDNGVLVESASGTPFAFEIMVAEQRQERYALNFARSLQRIGIAVSVRQVDSVQYETRRQTYDFDMVENFWYASLSPGNEQHFYWSVEAAGQQGTRNYMGAREPAIDAMIEALLATHERQPFVAAVRALDRLLISGNYVIPLFHSPTQWIAYRSRLGHPDRHSIDGFKIDTWWVEPGR